MGERRECLIILEKVDWKDGLLKDLVTDEEVSSCFRESCLALGAPSTVFKPFLTDLCACCRPELSVTSKISNEERNCIIKIVSNFLNLSLL